MEKRVLLSLRFLLKIWGSDKQRIYFEKEVGSPLATIK